VHAFDQMVADRYAGDGVESHRTVRADYQVAPPRLDPGPSAAAAPATDRHEARAKARAAT